MRAVVTIVVSRAETNRQSHSPATIVCILAGLRLGTMESSGAGCSVTGVVFSVADMVAKYVHELSSSLLIDRSGLSVDLTNTSR